jgi:hypothetical protein
MRSPKLAIVALGFAGLCACPFADTAAKPPAQGLQDKATEIRSAVSEYRRIDISAQFKQDNVINLMARVRYRGPNRYCLTMVDTTDGTPIWYLADEQLMLYDVVAGSVLYIPETRFEFRFGCKDGSAVTELSLERSAEPSKILIDVDSLFGPEIEGVSAVPGERGTTRLTRRLPRGKSLRGVINRSRPASFEQITLWEIGTPERRLVECRFSVNDKVGEGSHTFPQKDVLARKLPIKDWSKKELFDETTFLKFLSRSGHARPALADRELRRKFEDDFGGPVDWEQLAENDRRISHAIRQLLPELLETKGQRKEVDEAADH